MTHPRPYYSSDTSSSSLRSFYRKSVYEASATGCAYHSRIHHDVLGRHSVRPDTYSRTLTPELKESRGCITTPPFRALAWLIVCGNENRRDNSYPAGFEVIVM